MVGRAGWKNIARQGCLWLHLPGRSWPGREIIVMTRKRMCVLYSGRVQGVGFRYSVRAVATGFDVSGTVRNLSDGRVELLAEGDKTELDAFRAAILDSGLAANVRHEDVAWSEATGGFRGFEIVR
jgi:acylphosphatase